jgi:hypothetical protein
MHAVSIVSLTMKQMVCTATLVLEVVKCTPIKLSYKYHYTLESLQLVSSHFWLTYCIEGLNELILILVALKPFRSLLHDHPNRPPKIRKRKFNFSTGSQYLSVFLCVHLTNCIIFVNSIFVPPEDDRRPKHVVVVIKN